jgi:hypothetical protein
MKSTSIADREVKPRLLLDKSIGEPLPITCRYKVYRQNIGKTLPIELISH